MSTYTLNPAWKSFFFVDDGQMKSISHLFEKRPSLGELKIVQINDGAQVFDAVVVSQFSSTATDYWKKTPGIDAYPCISLIKDRGICQKFVYAA